VLPKSQTIESIDLQKLLKFFSRLNSLSKPKFPLHGGPKHGQDLNYILYKFILETILKFITTKI
jgi:hypothetical protein